MAESRVSLSPVGMALLLSAIFVVAGCGIVYELLIGSTSSYFLGNSVEQFSLTIGFFLFAMGVGSWISGLIQEKLLERLIGIEIWLGLVGGVSVPFLYSVYAESGRFRYWMVVLIVAIGILIGLEIPLLARILRGAGSLRSILANVLALDYLGALIAALIFPYLLLPSLGALHTSLVAGLVNLAVGTALLAGFWGGLSLPSRRFLALQSLAAVLVLVVLLVKADPLLERWESKLYADRIVFSEQSRYQKIVLTSWQDDLRLYLNGHLQFSALDEDRYHEALVHPAMELTANRSRVLIIGGGDGLSAREVLKYDDVERIDLVDLDPAVTDLARRNPHVAELNQQSLSNFKVRILNEDGFSYLQRSHLQYGVIFVDLPDPREESLAKLYSVEAYELAERLLSPGGVVATQATSPYFSRTAFWCIGKTIEEAGFQVHSYHLLVPSFGEWGFHLGTRKAIDHRSIQFSSRATLLNAETWDAMSVFDRDMRPVPATPNRLDKPMLARYYRQDWEQW
jgi:spermidine synthase